MYFCNVILSQNNTLMKKTLKLLALVAMMAGLAFASCDNLGGGTETAEWVDLGLPSGLLWAKCNLGATKPEEYGDYYAWGETDTKEVYFWETYKYCTAVDEEGWVKTLSKYNTDSEYGTPDHLTTLQPSDDVATAKLGNGARMPTETEWNELLDNTTSEWATVNGVYGRKLTAAAGDPYMARYFHIGTWNYPADVDNDHRFSGFSVRAVRASQN